MSSMVRKKSEKYKLKIKYKEKEQTNYEITNIFMHTHISTLEQLEIVLLGNEIPNGEQGVYF